MDSRQFLQFCKNVALFVLFALCVAGVVAYCASANHCAPATTFVLSIATFLWFAVVVPFLVVKMDDPLAKEKYLNS